MHRLAAALAATPPWVRRLARHALAALPMALVAGVALGLTLALGANLSNAFPSADRPFGWPGPATFENGVAMVRPALAIVGSLPGLALGWLAASRWRPADGWQAWASRVLVAAALLALAVVAGAKYGVEASAGAGDGAYADFVRAHVLLGLAFLAVGALAGTAAPRTGLAWGLGAWFGTMVLLDDFLKLRVFREVGYEGVGSGALPSWFFVAQGLSPLAAYRAVLILDRKGFRDWTERAVLENAQMPGWLTSDNVAWLMLGLWVLLPLALAAGAAAWRSRRHRVRWPGAALSAVPGAAALASLEVLPRTVPAAPGEAANEPTSGAPATREGGDRRPRASAGADRPPRKGRGPEERTP